MGGQESTKGERREGVAVVGVEVVGGGGISSFGEIFEGDPDDPAVILHKIFGEPLQVVWPVSISVE